MNAQNMAVIFFLAFFLMASLYVGKSREYNQQKQWADYMYEMLTPIQKKKLHEYYESQIEVELE